ncbi:unnamed protein product [Aphanomyces euteiches]|uniref:Uncharacterized protein n=1 Tax=Aphanomyces euteiches TaxID=100861 RepID=A0A6G0XYA2_9STRA|nr:hypothetical protein Ae201684_000471 [Aphanomyces euteiches]KAH9091823.1 hypothetical protein Ae201684P_011366 [Aphanomyces euteiches]KAH9146010.1 hypothetical protein AeRB84_010122 [Aphanomyces euteiches]
MEFFPTKTDLGKEEAATEPPSRQENGAENYRNLVINAGLLTPDGNSSVRVDTFDELKLKVKRLALWSGFEVKLDGRSDKRRRWKCTSSQMCPFRVTGNMNRHGIFVKTHLQHNHGYHVREETNKRFTTATSHELACIVRRSDLYETHGPDLVDVTGQQISDCIYDLTGFHINQMRASRIKRMLMDDPDRFLGSNESPETVNSTPAESAAVNPPAEAKDDSSSGNPHDVVWECFVFVANDPHVLGTMGMANVKKMVAKFKSDAHKATLRAICRMSCPDPSAPLSVLSNRPIATKFLECYQRQVDLGFFNDD